MRQILSFMAVVSATMACLSPSLVAQTFEGVHGDLASRLESAGAHRADLEAALASAEDSERPLLEFLIAYLPDRDLGTIDSTRLLETVELALKVKGQNDWQRTIPTDVFLNNVLPYANMDESRDPWRANFQKRFLPLVKDARSSTEAAQILNQKIFQELGVKYSTGRKRANQSPTESIEQGLASCSGLSIILVDACRAVGVPARIAGIPKWANKNGNHTWVEIWDGDWHFTGAAEYDAGGLDRTWFNADASLADETSLMSSIYAVSYKPTGKHFPLVWDLDDRSIHAVNVTARYTRNRIAPDPTKTRFLVRGWNSDRSKRVAVKVIIESVADPSLKWEKVTRDESFDTNDIIEFSLDRNARYQLTAEWPTGPESHTFDTDDAPQQIVDIPSRR